MVSMSAYAYQEALSFVLARFPSIGINPPTSAAAVRVLALSTARERHTEI
jgi:hypothetical protein